MAKKAISKYAQAYGTGWRKSAGLAFAARKNAAAERDARGHVIPPDTRNLTQRLLGDPLPGRSALDKRGGA